MRNLILTTAIAAVGTTALLVFEHNKQNQLKDSKIAPTRVRSVETIRSIHAAGA